MSINKEKDDAGLGHVRTKRGPPTQRHWPPGRSCTSHRHPVPLPCQVDNAGGYVTMIATAFAVLIGYFCVAMGVYNVQVRGSDWGQTAKSRQRGRGWGGGKRESLKKEATPVYTDLTLHKPCLPFTRRIGRCWTGCTLQSPPSPRSGTETLDRSRLVAGTSVTVGRTSNLLLLPSSGALPAALISSTYHAPPLTIPESSRASLRSLVLV